MKVFSVDKPLKFHVNCLSTCQFDSANMSVRSSSSPPEHPRRLYRTNHEGMGPCGAEGTGGGKL
jgi:hypothetical protein